MKYLKGYLIAALVMLVVAACSTTQNLPQRQGDTHLEALASPGLSTAASPGSISWTFNENLNVEIIGAGMGSAEAVLNNPATLNIADTSTIQKIVLVAVVKGGSDLSGSPHLYPPTTVDFTVNGTVYPNVGPTHTTNFGWHHELVVPFASAPASPLAVSAKVNNPTVNDSSEGIGPLYSPRSFTAFVSRTASASRPASSGSIPHADLWWYHGRVEHVVNLAIPTTTGPRDVNVSFALTELTNERTAVVKATADGVPPVSETFTSADNNKGAELAIHTLTLSGVPGTTSNVSVTFTSPLGDVNDFVNTGGDSFFVTGVSATSDVPLPQAEGETATGAGYNWSATQGAPSNWFMYTPWKETNISPWGRIGVSTSAPLIAGQHHRAGTITGTRGSGSNSTSITITLANGWRFANASANVKINPMSCTTGQPYVSPGQFSVHRTASVNDSSITVPNLSNTACYGIHVDVERQ